MQEYCVQYEFYPWRALTLVGQSSTEEKTNALAAAKLEWSTVLALESQHREHWLTKSLLQSRWQAYRSLMVAMEASEFNISNCGPGSTVEEMVLAYTGGEKSDLQSHKIELTFNDLRDLETRGSRRTSAAGGAQMLAVAVKSLEKRQPGYTKIKLSDSDLAWARAQASKPMRSSLFDCSQASPNSWFLIPWRGPCQAVSFEKRC